METPYVGRLDGSSTFISILKHYSVGVTMGFKVLNVMIIFLEIKRFCENFYLLWTSAVKASEQEKCAEGCGENYFSEKSLKHNLLEN